ncbi:SgcJ/EcaC family oxidoreductase [Streptomyces olivochromogenes]|uniref:SgcJ/EcaC family oxidoreductase n=1 Tax=Streptomyces olivochromogenes TaxID=1963 RepID=UPI0036DDD1F9
MAVSEEKMKSVLAAYIDGYANSDPEALAGLFAEDALWEDPVGSTPLRGRQEILAFIGSAAADTYLTLDTEIRASHGNEAAMAFTIDTVIEGKPTRIKAIDVMTFDDDGKISSMRAYWGPSDVTELPQN